MRTSKHGLHRPPRITSLNRESTYAFERASRLERIEDDLLAAGYVIVDDQPHEDGVIEDVHGAGLLTFLAQGHDDWIAAGGPDAMIPDTFLLATMEGPAFPATAARGAPGTYCFDIETPIVRGTWAAARSAVDCVLTACDALLSGTAVSYALCRPPGHHAGRNYYGGYCYLNNAAIAATYVSASGPVTLLDLDYHHGNGSQDIFWDSNAVRYVSLHADPDQEYPYFTGRREETGARGDSVYNYPLAGEVDEDRYLATLDEALEHASGQAVVVSIGYDTFVDDPLGTFALETSSYARIGSRLRELSVPLVLVQEGGYAVDDLGACAVQLMAGLSGQRDG